MFTSLLPIPRNQNRTLCHNIPVAMQSSVLSPKRGKFLKSKYLATTTPVLGSLLGIRWIRRRSDLREAVKGLGDVTHRDVTQTFFAQFVLLRGRTVEPLRRPLESPRRSDQPGLDLRHARFQSPVSRNWRRHLVGGERCCLESVDAASLPCMFVQVRWRVGTRLWQPHHDVLCHPHPL